MINSFLKPEEFRNWNDVPVSTKDEILAEKATSKFAAEASLTDKVRRVFNGTMFFIAGAEVLSFIPQVASAGSALSGMGFAYIGGASLLQIPVVVVIISVAPKIIVALAIVVVIRKVGAVAINHLIYISVLHSYFNRDELDLLRWSQFESLYMDQFECRRIALNKSGIDYDAFVIEHEETKGNGNWVIVAGGNAQIGEKTIDVCAQKFKRLGFNVLYVNGPGVARSSGFPTSYSIGAGQEAGLQFLEKGVKAQKILLYGLSLGGGAQGEAILSHEFRDDVDYMAWSDRSFDKVSNAASSMVTNLAKPIFFVLGVELNNVAAARKLQELGITHIVTQNSQAVEENGILPLTGKIYEEGDDAIIPNRASLYVGIRKAGIQDSDRIKCYGGPEISHNGYLGDEVEALIEADIQAFLADS